MIYLDNNATTQMPPQVVKTMIDWCNRGNPSADYSSAQRIKKMMADFGRYINQYIGPDYRLIYTSGASEANSMVCNQVKKAGGHIVASAIEHKSIILGLANANVTWVQPTPSGHVAADDVAAAIRPETVAVFVMAANNETGAINDLKAIRKMLPRTCFLFSDAVQLFGKFPAALTAADAFSVSFHKIYGPPGVGLLAIKNGVTIDPLIYGTQNDGLRGGTENVPGIGASFAAIKWAFTDRFAKNDKLRQLKQHLMDYLRLRYNTRQHSESSSVSPRERNYTGTHPQVVFLSDIGDRYLPNTLMISLTPIAPLAICNGKMKRFMESQGIIVAVGSACNTKSAAASHVLTALGVEDWVRSGTLRISFSDITTIADIDACLTAIDYIMAHPPKFKK